MASDNRGPKDRLMPRHASAKRNILLAVLLVVLVGALIVVMPLLRSTTPLMPPESAEVMAKRTAPEMNAYAALWEAMSLKPENPAPLAMPDKANPQVTTPYAFERGSLGELLRILRPDDDPALIRYIVQCDPAIAKVREALTRPCFLLPITWPELADPKSAGRQGTEKQESLAQLGAILVARGVIAVRQEQGKDALALLLDAYRLALLVRGDGDTPVAMIMILNQAVPHWFEVAHASSEADLRAALAALEALDDATKPTTANLEFALRMVDNSAPPGGWLRIPDRERRNHHRHDDHVDDGDAEFARKVFFTSHLRRAHRFALANRDMMFATVVMSYPEYIEWTKSHNDLLRSSQRAWPCDPMVWVKGVVAMQARMRLACAGAKLMTALELHRLAYGAYPETLDALTPEFLKAVPEDPFNAAPFHYERTDQDYVLSSAGTDQKNDSADKGKTSDDIVLHEPKGEPS